MLSVYFSQEQEEFREGSCQMVVGGRHKEIIEEEIFKSFTVEAGQRCERFDQIYVLVVLQTHGFKIFAQHLFGEENKTHINPKSFSSRLKLVYLI